MQGSDLTLTPRYTAIVTSAATIARDMGSSHVGVEHLFLAIIRDRRTVPTQVLERLVSVSSVEENLLNEMMSPGYNTATYNVLTPDDDVTDG